MNESTVERVRALMASAQARLTKSLWKIAYDAAPSVILDPEQEMTAPKNIGAANRVYYRERDPKDNAKTAPAEGEAINLRFIVGVEFYTPGSFRSLSDAFIELGWETENRRTNKESPSAWLSRLRANPHVGGRYNLGVLVRNKSCFWGDQRVSPLPDSAEYAFGHLVSVTSSVSAIVLTFVLTEESALCLDRAVREPRNTREIPLGGRRYSIEQPTHQKREAVRSARRALRAEVADWFTCYLPGLFSSGHLDGEFPTCEFTTLKIGEPFQSGRKGHQEYLSLLELDGAYGSWKADGGLYFLPGLRWESSQHHAIASACEADFEPADFKFVGGISRSGIATRYGEQLEGLVERWALLALLSGYENFVNAIRDSASLRGDRGSPSQLMQDLRTFVGRATEVSFVASELKVLAQSEHRFGCEFDRFEARDTDRKELGLTTLSAALSGAVKWRAKRLEAADRSIREILTQYGTVLTAQENYKLQTHVGRLTFGALVFGVLAALFAAENSSFIRCLAKGVFPQFTCS